MKKAWQDPTGTIRDVCHGDPAESYHPDIAGLYITVVPGSTVNGATFSASGGGGGVWTNPPPPPAPVPPTAAEKAAASAAALALAAETLQEKISTAAQARLDTFARDRGYDSILSAATYAGSKVPKFSAEGKYAIDARDQTWGALYLILADVQAGRRPWPSGFAELEAELPILAWPT